MLYICTYMKQFLSSLLAITLCVVWISQLSSCANIIPPSGGPRDSLPPRLVTATPKDSAVQVTSRNITLTFDEYVTLQNASQSLILSPNHSAQGQPFVDYKLRNVIVRLKDSLEANTTYSLNFGDAIRDVNEGNIAQDFTYVFSTGSSIDDNTYSGKVILAEKGSTDSTLIVLLHKNLADTAVIKERPRYYTRLNGKGEFNFRNLPQGQFAVYVLPGSGISQRYDDSTKMFAFRSSPVTVNAGTRRDTLYAFEEVKRKEFKSTGTTAPKATAAVRDEKRLRYTHKLDNGLQDLLSPLTLSFNRKLTVFDSSKFILSDTVSFAPLQGVHYHLDSTRTKILISYPWKEAQAFRLQVSQDAVADSAGNRLSKGDTLRFFAKRGTDYGSIRIRFTSLDLGRNPVLQFVQNDAIVESVPLTVNDFQRKLYPPGTYELRILYDTNKNGVWDSGNFKQKRQPEVVYLVPRQLAIRANWDNEVTIAL